MRIYYKATRLDGTDFRSGLVDYGGALVFDRRVHVDTPTQSIYACCTKYVLHASDIPAETLIGGYWPCRLFEVTGRPVAQDGHKHAFRSLRVERETDAWRALGPNGAAVAALIAHTKSATSRNDSPSGAVNTGLSRTSGPIHNARRAANSAANGFGRVAAYDAAWSAAWGAQRGIAGSALRDAAGNAARALVVRDLIGRKDFTTLTKNWVNIYGPIGAAA